MLSLVQLVAGVVGLYFGAEWLVRGASRIAAHVRVSPLMIGLTVVAFGTSMPEMAAGVLAAWRGNTDIVLGNVFGSNVANVGLILGLTALFRVIPVSIGLLKREMPIMLAVTALAYGLAWWGSIGQLVGAAMFAALILFTWLTLRWSRDERKQVQAQSEPELGLEGKIRTRVEGAYVLAGLVTMTAGAHFMVEAAVDLATAWGVSQFLISASLVAVGTSLPELATSIVSVLRGETDLLVGNIVGSNIFNILGALGISAVVRPLPVPAEFLGIDLLAAPLFAIAMALVLLDRRVGRFQGAPLLVGYGAYVYLLLQRG